MDHSGGDKPQLRQKFKNLRRDFKATAEDRLALKHNLESLVSQFKDSQVALYRARGNEAPCELAPETEYFYPVMDEGRLDFFKPTHGGAFAVNAYLIEEPLREEAVPIDLTKPTVVCCPALAADEQGTRLGLGKGFYDRFFNEHDQFLRVGVIYQFQFSPHPLPADSWDQALDWIVSEKMILRTSPSTQRSFQ